MSPSAASEKPEDTRRRARVIMNRLRKAYPDASTALNHGTALELLIATILSAQCTDERVNKVTPELFARFARASDYAKADRAQLEEMIRSTGFYRNKAKSIQGATHKLVEKFRGEVPQTMEELTALPGVGRKTANVLLGNAFNIPGIVCDTHVIRLSRRLALSENSDPVKLEFDLADRVPKKRWTLLSHLLVFHGRRICKARKPNCPDCPITAHCPVAHQPELW